MILMSMKLVILRFIRLINLNKILFIIYSLYLEISALMSVSPSDVVFLNNILIILKKSSYFNPHHTLFTNLIHTLLNNQLKIHH